MDVGVLGFQNLLCYDNNTEAVMCISEPMGQNPLLRGKCIRVTHCDNNLLQVGAGGQIWPAET